MDLVKNESEFHDKVTLVDDQGTLKCEEMYLFTRKSAPQSPASAPAVKTPAEEDPDADPFSSSRSGEGRCARSDCVDRYAGAGPGAVQTECGNSRRTKEGELQRAGGEQADYMVEEKRIIMTGTPQSRPWMSAQGGAFPAIGFWSIWPMKR